MCTLPQDEYLLDVCFVAIGHDSLNSSRPISSPAENPTQIEQMFDAVSYDKVGLKFWWFLRKIVKLIFTYVIEMLLNCPDLILILDIGLKSVKK